MALSKNQIRSLVLWVHPGHQPVSDEVLTSWRNMIEVLQYEPRVALLETSNVSSGNPYSKHPQNKRLDWFTRAPYGKIINESGWNEEDVKPPQKVGDLEGIAKRLLGDRFHVWPHGNFLENNPHHLLYLQDVFNIEPRVLVPGRHKLLFVTLACYGLKPDACVTWQMYDRGIRSLTHELMGGYLHPENGLKTFVLYPQLDKNYRPVYPFYVEGVPSTQESLKELTKQGAYRYCPLNSIKKMLRNLPSARSEEAKGIILDPWKEERPEMDQRFEENERVEMEIFSR